ncbi:TetR family transcriptional regulator [Kitasatospora sp. NPDC091207]|uniref:TetR/AcrR family transcriptional regulator n=1 Tax=Kitasatospora sp. NPDC091207 TaxID=3364083 RepID=UPI00381E571B
MTIADETGAAEPPAELPAEPLPGPPERPGGADPAADQGTGRDAILRAARRAFALRPYADVTMRGIAADAGVSPSLIVKRFGSKEHLFNTVADFRPAADELFAAERAGLGRHLVLTTVRMRREQRGDPLLRVVFALGNEDERTLLRERFRHQVTERLAASLPGPDAELRAELIAGQLLGLGATLSLHRPGAGDRATPERLADLYAPALQRLIDGD